jgi:hypothetical protein
VLNGMEEQRNDDELMHGNTFGEQTFGEESKPHDANEVQEGNILPQEVNSAVQGKDDSSNIRINIENQLAGSQRTSEGKGSIVNSQQSKEVIQSKLEKSSDMENVIE